MAGAYRVARSPLASRTRMRDAALTCCIASGGGVWAVARADRHPSSDTPKKISQNVIDSPGQGRHEPCIICHYLIDQPNCTTCWGGQAIPQAMVEAMAEYSKSIRPGMTTIARAGGATSGRDTAGVRPPAAHLPERERVRRPGELRLGRRWGGALGLSPHPAARTLTPTAAIHRPSQRERMLSMMSDLLDWCAFRIGACTPRRSRARTEDVSAQSSGSQVVDGRVVRWGAGEAETCRYCRQEVGAWRLGFLLSNSIADSMSVCAK